MATILDRIFKTKQQEVAELLTHHPLAELEKAARLAPAPRDFLGQMAKPGIRVIAEVKKASPSAGVLRNPFIPGEVAKFYADHGAACISVLTDKDYFQGCLQDLEGVRSTVTLPALRKDFLIDPAQVFEARIHGADAILLIVAALDDELLKRLYHTAKDLMLDVLVEVHDLQEMERALELGADLIGINNRNLRTFAIDLATTEALVDEVPEDVLLVSESGIKTLADAQRVLDAGANAVLIGESLMRSADPAIEIEGYHNLVASGGFEADDAVEV